MHHDRSFTAEIGSYIKSPPAGYMYRHNYMKIVMWVCTRGGATLFMDFYHKSYSAAYKVAPAALFLRLYIRF